MLWLLSLLWATWLLRRTDKIDFRTSAKGAMYGNLFFFLAAVCSCCCRLLSVLAAAGSCLSLLPVLAPLAPHLHFPPHFQWRIRTQFCCYFPDPPFSSCFHCSRYCPPSPSSPHSYGLACFFLAAVCPGPSSPKSFFQLKSFSKRLIFWPDRGSGVLGPAPQNHFFN